MIKDITKVKIAKICEVMILAVAVYMLGYNRIFGYMDYGNTIKFIIGMIGIFLYILVYFITQKNVIFYNYSKIAIKYTSVLTIIIILYSIYTFVNYDCGVIDILNIIVPYSMIYYCLPIIYIFYSDKTIELFVKKISYLVLIIILIKAYCWAMYNYFGVVFFEDLLFQYKEWSRNGFLRLDPGYLYGTILCYYSSKFFSSRNSKDFIVMVFLFLFVVFITQFRFQLIVNSVVLLCLLYFHMAYNKNKFIIKFCFILAITVIYIYGSFDSLIYSFDINNNDTGGSTLARINTICYYWDLLITNHYFLGLGLLNSSVPDMAKFMFFYNQWGIETQYFLEDIGLLGTFFEFGITSFIIYGYLYRYIFLVFKKSLKYGSEFLKLFAISNVLYLGLSCIALNIFDTQRIFNLPFYMAIISYCSFYFKISNGN